MTAVRLDAPIRRFDGRYSFLSNFAKSPITIGDEVFPTVEHAYQALKTDNKEDRKMIAKAGTPAKAKQMGARVELREGWDDPNDGTCLKYVVMEMLLTIKFAPGSEMAKKLIATGDREISEGNWWGDTYWGVFNGSGQNFLGKLLMEIREDLKRREAQEKG